MKISRLRCRYLVSLLAVALLWACTDDTTVVVDAGNGGQDAQADATADAAQDAALDMAVDTAPDTEPLPVDVTSQALDAAWRAARVMCINSDGSQTQDQIAIVDEGTTIVEAATRALVDAPQKTLDWVGSDSAVSIRWDPNSCDNVENPYNAAPDFEWGEAGFLVRGVEFGSGAIRRVRPVTTADVNLVDLLSDGGFETDGIPELDMFEPDDALLTNHPQLVMPVNKAKEILVDLLMGR